MPPHCIVLAVNKKTSPLRGGPYFSFEYFTNVCWQNDSTKEVIYCSRTCLTTAGSPGTARPALPATQKRHTIPYTSAHPSSHPSRSGQNSAPGLARRSPPQTNSQRYRLHCYPQIS